MAPRVVAIIMAILACTAAALRVVEVRPRVLEARSRLAAAARTGRLVAQEDAEGGDVCWVLKCSAISDDAVMAISDVLSDCQRQGNWLRGLQGAVLVESETALQILTSGPESRVNSFADWAKGKLGETQGQVLASLAEDEADVFCSVLPLSSSFSLSAAEGVDDALKFWQSKVAPEKGDVMTGWSEEAQY